MAEDPHPINTPNLALPESSNDRRFPNQTPLSGDVPYHGALDEALLGEPMCGSQFNQEYAFWPYLSTVFRGEANYLLVTRRFHRLILSIPMRSTMRIH